MSHLIKTACVLAGFAVASMAAGSAHAGKKPLTVQQKNQMAAEMLRNNQAKAKTTRKAVSTLALQSPSPTGGIYAEVPVELDHYLTASPDANGNMRVRDTDAHGPSTTSTTSTVEASNEK